jgi:hypothetical protein
MQFEVVVVRFSKAIIDTLDVIIITLKFSYSSYVFFKYVKITTELIISKYLFTI